MKIEEITEMGTIDYDARATYAGCNGVWYPWHYVGPRCIYTGVVCMGRNALEFSMAPADEDGIKNYVKEF